MELKKLKELLKTAYRKLKAMPEDPKDITFEEYLLRHPKSEIGKFFAYFEDSPNWDDEEIAAREDHMLCEIIRIDIVNHVQIFRTVFKQLLLGADYIQNRQLVARIIEFYKLK